MTFPLVRRGRRGDTIEALYGAIVAQARCPAFYADYGVPDTVEARFDMLVLHVALLFRRMRDAGSSRALGQGVFDRFCKDMEDNLREMGVGDLSVPKSMRRIGEAFYGRAAAYDEALASPSEEALVAALSRNVFAGASVARPQRLATYVRTAVAELARQPDPAFAAGQVSWPDPATPVAGAGGR